MYPSSARTGPWIRQPAVCATLAAVAAVSLLAVAAQVSDRSKRDRIPAAAQPMAAPDGPAQTGVSDAHVGAMSAPMLHPVATVSHLRPASTAAQRDLRSLVERHLLNALLVPVIDDDATPPRFADPSLSMACGTGARIDVNGRPLRPGAPQSERFQLRWTLDQCLPFGFGGPALHGVAVLDVQREPRGLRALVQLDALRVERGGVAIALNGTWVATTP